MVNISVFMGHEDSATSVNLCHCSHIVAKDKGQAVGVVGLYSHTTHLQQVDEQRAGFGPRHASSPFLELALELAQFRLS